MNLNKWIDEMNKGYEEDNCEEHPDCPKCGNISCSLFREIDIRKKQYCEENGIILLQIPFWDTKKLNLEYLREVINEINN